MLRLLTFALFVTTAVAEARSYKYDCYSYYWNGSRTEKGTMSLSVNARLAHGRILNLDWAQDLGGRIEPDYRSEGDIPFVKYDTLIIEKSLQTGGRRLRDGHWGGFARVEGQNLGSFYQYKFICKLQ